MQNQLGFIACNTRATRGERRIKAHDSGYCYFRVLFATTSRDAIFIATLSRHRKPPLNTKLSPRPRARADMILFFLHTFPEMEFVSRVHNKKMNSVESRSK